MSRRRIEAGLVLVMAVTAATGCQRLDSSELAAQSAPATVAAATESQAAAEPVLTIEEEVALFRQEVGESADALAGGAQSREALVRRFIAALEAGDGPALGPMLLGPAEFIDLYYPHTRFTARPYEMSPQLVWFQLENYGSRGVFRALNRYGGHPLRYRGHRCETTTEEGPNTVYGGCVVDIANPETGQPETVSLFGQILERDGHFKFISYGNRL